MAQALGVAVAGVVAVEPQVGHPTYFFEVLAMIWVTLHCMSMKTTQLRPAPEHQQADSIAGL